MINEKDVSMKPSMASIGEKLKNARERKNLTIEQVQKQTRIHSTVLAALEEGRCDELLTYTYVRSFLSKYAGYLGLDPKETVKEYASLHSEEPDFQKASESNKVDAQGLEVVSKFIYVISFVLLLVALVSLTAFLWKKVTPTVARSLKPKRALVKTVQVVPQKTKTQALSKTAAKTPPQTAIPKKGPFKLDLKIRQKVLVEIKKDGVLIFKRSLPKGTVESLTANDKIELYVARAEAIELVLNGRSLGSPGKGIIKNLEITAKGIRIK